MKRRGIAIAIVLCTGATIAYGDFAVTTSPTTTAGTGSNGTQMRTVFSIRNTAPDAVVATVGAMPIVACTGLVLTDINGMSAAQWAFDPGEQRQFVIQASYASAGLRTCLWNVAAPAQMTAQFTSSFNVDPATQMALNTQPVAFDFAVTGASETQIGYLQNYALSQLAYTAVTIEDGGANVMAIAGGPCNGMKTCAGTTVNGGSFVATGFKCTPTATQVTGTITYMLTAGGTRTHTFTCRRAGAAPIVDVMPSPLVLKGAAGTPTSTSAQVFAAQADSLQTATIIGADASAFKITQPAPPCTATQTCTWSPAEPIPAGSAVSLSIECTPGATQKTAKLRVKGTAHAADIDEADLSCVADSGASTNVSDLEFGDVKVTTTSAPQPITITNLSTTAQVAVTVDTGHPDWLVDTCATPCTIPAGGNQIVQVRFKPAVPAQNDRTLKVFVGGTVVATVALRGNGTGSRLRVTNQTTPYVVDFGTIGLGALRTRDITLKADGNRSLNVAIGTPAVPFSISVPAVDLAAGADGAFDIRCQSSAAGMFTGMVTLAPGPDTHVYAADTPKLDVRCKVANTVVQVTPDELDFGEKRRNEPPSTIVIAITNPGTTPIPLDYVRLTDATALTLSVPADPMLDPGETIMAQLTLATVVELTLESALEIGVGGEQLVTPITGKVVTASARVTPTALKLGSVCIGTQIAEPIKLANVGTANLRAQPPVMDNPFAVMFVSPVSYPEGGALLSPGDAADATVTLSTLMKGRVAGTLTWDIDAPEAPFVIEAAVEVKEDGTAVSPQAIGFDQIRVDERSERRTIRLENCGDFATNIQLLGVTSTRGDASAWQLMPPKTTTFLQAGEKLTIDVYFAPKRTGPHLASVELVIDGLREEIELTGEAIGDAAERKSLYGCDCNTGGAPSLLLVLVLFAICRRRT
jgi:hypothetical protein